MKMTMDLGKRSYDMIIKRGVLDKVNMLANLNRRVLVVSDSGVPDTYIHTLLQQCVDGHSFVFEAGEANKTATVWQDILARMNELNMGKNDLLVALGGGLVCDITGFAAANYLRGISYIVCPTTTLAQIDASVGGMVSINLGQQKNLVGTYYQPKLVAADPDTLATLDPRHFANGLAEALKAGLVGSRELFELLEQGDLQQELEKIIYLSTRFKKGVVERDETGSGERKLLGFGYTMGRALELAGEGTPKELLHGECIALGMLPMIESRTLARRARAVMRRIGLPMRIPFDKQTLLEIIQSEQQRNHGLYTLVRVKHPGHGYLETVDFDEVELLIKGS